MLKARAVGGPLDGVLLTGDANWDGRIKLSGQSPCAATVRYHPGHYRWGWGAWRWRHDESMATQIRRPSAVNV